MTTQQLNENEAKIELEKDIQDAVRKYYHKTVISAELEVQVSWPLSIHSAVVTIMSKPITK